MSIRIGVIIGSIRPGRQGDKPAHWIAGLARDSGLFGTVDLIDLKDYPLPLFDAPASDLWVPTTNAVAAKWQSTLAAFDGFIIVTPEYNHSIPGALKNAIDWAYRPFVRKAVAYVSYGSVGGARSVEHLRAVMVELQAVSIRNAIHIGGSDFVPVMMGQKTWDEVLPLQEPYTHDLLRELLWWASATKLARNADRSAVQAA